MTRFKKALAEANCTPTSPRHRTPEPFQCSGVVHSSTPSTRFVYLCMCTHRHTSACTEKSEANLHGLGDGIQTLRLGVKYPYPMSRLHLELNLISTQSHVLV